MIEYTSLEGYRGVLYGKSSMSIYGPDGKEVLHTGSRTPNTLEELKEVVDKMQEFVKMLALHWEEMEVDDEGTEI